MAYRNHFISPNSLSWSLMIWVLILLHGVTAAPIEQSFHRSHRVEHWISSTGIHLKSITQDLVPLSAIHTTITKWLHVPDDDQPTFNNNDISASHNNKLKSLLSELDITVASLLPSDVQLLPKRDVESPLDTTQDSHSKPDGVSAAKDKDKTMEKAKAKAQEEEKKKKNRQRHKFCKKPENKNKAECKNKGKGKEKEKGQKGKDAKGDQQKDKQHEHNDGKN